MSLQPYFRTLQEQVAAERRAHAVYPPVESVYSAFNYTPLDQVCSLSLWPCWSWLLKGAAHIAGDWYEQVKVVILGQDPYLREGQAHGLSFSVNRGVKVPPSLLKIYAELERSIPGWKRPNHGCLTEWAQRGVLLLNATLTVRDGEANAHAKLGWQTFTDEVIKYAGSLFAARAR
jgi:uracil-DNA glycosylase